MDINTILNHRNLFALKSESALLGKCRNVKMRCYHDIVGTGLHFYVYPSSMSYKAADNADRLCYLSGAAVEAATVENGLATFDVHHNIYEKGQWRGVAEKITLAM